MISSILSSKRLLIHSKSLFNLNKCFNNTGKRFLSFDPINIFKSKKDKNKITFYKCGYTNYLYYAYPPTIVFTIVTLSSNYNLLRNPEALGNSETIPVDFPVAFIALADFFILFVFALLTWIRKRTIYKISFNTINKNFEAEFQPWYHWRKTFTFNKGDVKMINNNKHFLLKNYEINGKKYFMMQKDFSHPTYYNLMMGQSAFENIKE